MQPAATAGNHSSVPWGTPGSGGLGVTPPATLELEEVPSCLGAESPCTLGLFPGQRGFPTWGGRPRLETQRPKGGGSRIVPGEKGLSGRRRRHLPHEPPGSRVPSDKTLQQLTYRRPVAEQPQMLPSPMPWHYRWCLPRAHSLTGAVCKPLTQEITRRQESERGRCPVRGSLPLIFLFSYS